MRFHGKLIGVLRASSTSIHEIFERPSMLQAFLIITAISILGGVAQALATLKVSIEFIEYPFPFQPPRLRITDQIIISWLFYMLGWVIMAFMLHIFVKLFKGFGRFKVGLSALGFILTPMIFASITSIICIYISQPVTIKVRWRMDPMEITEVVRKGMEAFYNSPPMLLKRYLGYLFTLWSILICMKAVRYGYGFSWRKAVLVTITFIIASSLTIVGDLFEIGLGGFILTFLLRLWLPIPL